MLEIFYREICDKSCFDVLIFSLNVSMAARYDRQ